jgi:periplasmic protein TonB
MNNTSIFDEDELDRAIDEIIASPDAAPAANAPEMAELLDIAADLRALPRADFKLQLGMELQWKASGRLVSNGSRPTLAASKWSGLEFSPTLFGSGKTYPVRPTNFAASLALHAAMVAFLFLGFLTVKNMPQVVPPRFVLVDAYKMPPGPAGYSGGGGQRDNTPATQGALPRSSRQQLTPPVVTIQNTAPRLAVQDTIVGPDPTPPSAQPGDPLASLKSLSGGPGTNGIGSGDGGGDGPGHGNRHGPGTDLNGFGAGYRPGNGVTAPRVIYSPEPEFSEEARKIKYQGVVTVEIVVGADGHPRNLRIERSLGMGLDEKALEAVRTWRFAPGTKDGHPVSVLMNIEVHFNLY